MLHSTYFSSTHIKGFLLFALVVSLLCASAVFAARSFHRAAPIAATAHSAATLKTDKASRRQAVETNERLAPAPDKQPAEHIEVENVTIRAFGFDPKEITRPQGTLS
jgi:hypothetical protein